MGWSYVFFGSTLDLVVRLGWDFWVLLRVGGFHLEMFSHEAYLHYEAEDWDWFSNHLYRDGLESFAPQEPHPPPPEPDYNGNHRRDRDYMRQRANRRRPQYRPG